MKTSPALVSHSEAAPVSSSSATLVSHSAAALVSHSEAAPVSHNSTALVSHTPVEETSAGLVSYGVGDDDDELEESVQNVDDPASDHETSSEVCHLCSCIIILSLSLSIVINLLLVNFISII